MEVLNFDFANFKSSEGKPNQMIVGQGINIDSCPNDITSIIRL